MGGCASRPKDLDINEPAPVQAPVVDKIESEPIAQENNGGEEIKTEEPLVDLSEPTGETAEPSESKPAEEAAHATEAKTEKAEAEEKKDEAEAMAGAKAEVAVTFESEKTPEPVKEEAKPVEAQKPEEKSDAPVVTV